MKNTKKTEVNAVIQDMLSEDARERLVFLDAECRGASGHENFIDNLDCSAKIKRVLRELAKRTANIGGRVLHVGKIALNFALRIVKEVHHRFPNVSCAILVLLILKVVIQCIPLFGFVLGALLEPLFLVVLVGIGVFKDLLDMVSPLVERHYHVSPIMVR